MKIGNKTINYSVYANKRRIGDTKDVQLPSIEYLTDTLKGSGIIGEVDLPSSYQASSMTLTISNRVSNDPEDITALLSCNDIEIRWVTDVIETTNASLGEIGHKAFIKGMLKKADEGKLEPGAGQDGSYEFEVFYYKRVTDGKTILEIDKLNGIFKINGEDKTRNINSLL